MDEAGETITTTEASDEHAPNVNEHILDVGQYLKLVQELRNSLQAVDEEGSPCDPLLKCTNALASILDFLHIDPVVQRDGLTYPLELLFAALHDKVQGAKSPLLDRPKKSGGKPTNLFRDLIRGQIVGALNTLIAAGMPLKDAANWLATEISRRGMKDPGHARITAEQCLNWRYRVQDGKAPEAQREMAADLAQERAKRPADIATVDAAKQQARNLLDVAKKYDFADTPHVTAKRSPPSSLRPNRTN